MAVLDDIVVKHFLQIGIYCRRYIEAMFTMIGHMSLGFRMTERRFGAGAANFSAPVFCPPHKRLIASMSFLHP